jgi:hypothetical protein
MKKLFSLLMVLVLPAILMHTSPAEAKKCLDKDIQALRIKIEKFDQEAKRWHQRVQEGRVSAEVNKKLAEQAEKKKEAAIQRLKDCGHPYPAVV